MLGIVLYVIMTSVRTTLEAVRLSVGPGRSRANFVYLQILAVFALDQHVFTKTSLIDVCVTRDDKFRKKWQVFETGSRTYFALLVNRLITWL